jgi:hypothetical protein
MDLADFFAPQLQDAKRRLFLSPEEQNLYRHHLQNLWGPGGVDNPDGSRSTVYTMGTEGPDGRQYNVPTVYDGQILPPDAAAARGVGGPVAFPSYPTPEAADARYMQMHDQMEKDAGADTDIRRMSFLPTFGSLWR